jgi:hypothetical protein
VVSLAYAAEVKGAVQAEVLAGNTPEWAAAKYGVSTTAARRWGKEATGQLRPLGPARAALLAYEVYELVRLNLRALTAINAVTMRPEYLETQNARDLAVLYGVLADKTFRVLAALQAGAEAG